jgi:hypothetical protein
MSLLKQESKIPQDLKYGDLLKQESKIPQDLKYGDLRSIS